MKVCRSSKFTTIPVIASLCILSLLVLSNYAGATATRPGGLKIEGSVSDRLVPGSTATVRLRIRGGSPRVRPVGQVTLKKIETDPAHSSCRASVGGPGADFSMPPIDIHVPPSAGGVVAASGLLTMNEVATDQDACRGARLRLIFAAD